ncbi:MAG: DUF3137 domain-containing protein [Alphaproteobacteria bacterium]
MAEIASKSVGDLLEIAGTFSAERMKLERRTLWVRIGLWSLCGACGATVLALIAGNEEEAGIKLSFVLMALAGAAIGVRRYLFSGFLQRFKHRIVPPLLAEFGAFQYATSTRTFNVGKMVTSGLLPSYDRLDSEDMVWGTYRGSHIEIVNVSAWIRRKKSTQNVFSGLLLRTKMPRDVEGIYGVFPASINAYARGRMNDFQNWDHIRLESPFFENLFDFYGSDQVLGRTLLTPTQIEKWISLAQNPFTANVTAIMRYGYLHLAVETKQNWIDDQILAYPSEKIEEQIEGIKADLKCAFHLIDILTVDESA